MPETLWLQSLKYSLSSCNRKSLPIPFQSVESYAVRFRKEMLVRPMWQHGKVFTSIKSGIKGIFCEKITPLLLLKYFHHREGGQQMLRSLVTMVIFWGCFSEPGILLSSCSDGHKAGGGAVVSYSQRGAGRQASVPSPQAKHLLRQRCGSLLPTNMSLVGAGVWLSCQLPSLHLRGRPPWRAGPTPVLPLHSCGKRRVGARLHLGPN